MSYNSRYPPRGGQRSSPRDSRDRGDYRDSRDHFSPRRDSERSNRDSGDTFQRSNLSYSERNRYEPRNSNFAPRSQQPPPPSYDAPPPPPPPGVDRYQMPQGDFTFRADKPAGVQDLDSYRPDQRGRRHRNERSNRASYPSRNHNGDRPHRGGGRVEGRRPWRPFVAAERELLRTDHNTGEEVEYFDTNAGATFRNLDELSDSEEAEMDISGDEEEESAEPLHKRARLSGVNSAVEDSVPKWSNPDPYTALPPETATATKKKDVVQLIRKARVQAKEIRRSLPGDAADFISLDFDESDHSEGEDVLVIHDSPADDLQPSVSAQDDGQPASKQTKIPSLIMPDPATSALGSRKRAHDDRIKVPHTRMKKPAKAPSGGLIVPEWQPLPNLTPTPWIRGDHSQAKGPLVWLHKEIVDFFDYIKPREFEERLRAELVQDMKAFCRDAYRDADIHAFGSFPSGLYLPTGDMDLVMLSKRFVDRGVAVYSTKKALFRFRDLLKAKHIPWQGDVELILHARVPLAKFIDRKTGLKVDVSFENSTGLNAIKTFLGWKEQYPGMPALVTLVKHFLLMRGLNEPVNGGIGGFSVICLVVSMLQMSPEVQSGALDTTHHLGELLMRFFDLYGNKFDYENVAIRLSPPGYVPKDRVHNLTYRNYNRLSIIDPNSADNDISGGSSNTPLILSAFSAAHRELADRMKQLAEDPRKNSGSILEVIIGGNYTSFEEQRNYLESLVERTDIIPSYEQVPIQHLQSGQSGSHSRYRDKTRGRRRRS